MKYVTDMLMFEFKKKKEKHHKVISISEDWW